MLTEVILATVFLAVVLTVWGVYAVAAQAPLRAQQKVIGYRIQALTRAGRRAPAGAAAALFKPEDRGVLAWAQELLLRFAGFRSLRQALDQADWRVSVVTFVLLAAAVGGGVLAATLFLLHHVWIALAFGLLGTAAPYLFLIYRRRKRFEKFQGQFPDAIDLLTRSVRSGHAIVAGFEMVAKEMESPIAEEFRQVYEEQKFGLALNQALLHLQQRVPLLEVRLFGTALAIQREVGGNLAEVLENIAHTLRERFKLLRQVRVYTAQGRLTGYILAAMPVFLSFMLLAINPKYFRVLLDSELGLMMLGVAALLQIAGYFWIRKIIHIKI